MKRCWSNSCCQKSAIFFTPVVKETSMQLNFGILPLGFYFLSAATTSMQSLVAFLPETAFKFKALKKVAQLAVINSLEKAFWNWVENYPDEFTKLYQIPQTDMAECAEKLFDLVDGFAESTKRKAAVWPLQIILLILCPEIIQDISKDVVDENNMNKVRRAELFPLYLDVKQFILLEVCITLGLLFQQAISGHHLNYFRFLCLMDLEETYSYIILFGRGKIIPVNDQRFKIIP
uniref:Neurofibromin 1 n=1 Tax=Macaca fascicularis TaxID=9541 RepID=A0A2K5WT36_MACFA